VPERIGGILLPPHVSVRARRDREAGARFVDVKVADTAPHGPTHVWKQARLENGLTLMVLPFIAPLADRLKAT